jgi:hypothetical protein
MYVEIEQSGCCERKGLMQVRFCLYLEPGDYGYEQHHLTVPVYPYPDERLGGYWGEVHPKGTTVTKTDKETGKKYEIDISGQPIDEDDYRHWVQTLPTTEIDNPFHNHFIYVEPEITDEILLDMGQAFLEEAYIKRACDEKIDIKNPPVKFREKGRTPGISQRLNRLPLNRRYV